MENGAIETDLDKSVLYFVSRQQKLSVAQVVKIHFFRPQPDMSQWMWFDTFSVTLETVGLGLRDINSSLLYSDENWEDFVLHLNFYNVIQLCVYIIQYISAGRRRLPSAENLRPKRLVNILYYERDDWPPLWSSGQSFWLQIQRSRVRFPALPDFLSSSGSGTGSTQPREVNRGATWIKK